MVLNLIKKNTNIFIKHNILERLLQLDVSREILPLSIDFFEKILKYYIISYSLFKISNNINSQTKFYFSKQNLQLIYIIL